MDISKLKISFIIVEFHSIDDVLACYSSIVNNISIEQNFEVIISSNSNYSQDEQKRFLCHADTLRWLFNEKNGGFAYAMNRGLTVATGDILVIMNPDVRIKSGIEEMIYYFFCHNKIGVIAPKIQNAKGEIQDSFRQFITPLGFLYRHISRIFKNGVGKYMDDSPKNVDWVIGAFMMLSCSSYNAVGGLDDNYFLYCEDMDLCRRMHQKGYTIVYYPKSVIE